MTRFRAINDPSSESDDDSEEKETKEAQVRDVSKVLTGCT